MTKEEITNSQDYKATKAALEWWYSLPEEQRKATDIDAEPDIIDAYSDGVIYGWNNPQWIPVEERKPQENQRVRAWSLENNEEYLCDYHDGIFEDFYGSFTDGKITHWMEIVPPRKEE